MNRAVLVGIETYNSPTVPGLGGCINDITGIRQFLTAATGFAQTDIVVLSNQTATAATIIADLTAMVGGLSAGDRLVFHYAGHGAQLVNSTGSAEDAIIPVDFAFPATNAIFGSQLAEIFATVPTDVSFAWIADCCNSGGQVRSLDRSSRGLVLPPELAAQVKALSDAGHLKSIRDLVQPLNLTMYAACGATEEANGAPIAGVWHGVLSYYLTSLLMTLATVTDSANQLIQQASVAIVPQFPQQRGGSG